MAIQLYTGILFDTGGFRFGNTSARSLRICGKLIECGATPDGIADAVFHRRSYTSLKLMGEALNSLTLHFGGQVSAMELDRWIPDGERGRDMDTEGFVDLGLSIDGVRVAFFLKRQDGDHFRVSLRAKDEVCVGDVARRFGGGGHSKAAGCRIRGTLEEAKAALLEEIYRHLSRFQKTF
jgi:phosphoesterase RecJ-like protein